MIVALCLLRTQGHSDSDTWVLLIYPDYLYSTSVSITGSLSAEHEVALNSEGLQSEHGQTFTVKSNDAYATTTMADSRTGTTVEEQLRMSSNDAYSTVVQYNEDNEYDYVYMFNRINITL